MNFPKLKGGLANVTKKMHLDKRKAAIILASAVILFLVVLPFYMGTVTYPLAIVEGNSMYPTLQNGDLVLFHAPTNPNNIPNGTIIVYVNTETGVSALDSLTKPIVIHRVIGEVIQSNGSVNYVTKGDNNLVQDPALVPANHVIGTPALVIPKMGLLFLFIQSPQGLVAAVGIITIVYLTKYEDKSSEEKKREAFLAALARMVLNNELTESLFKKLELAVKYFDDLKINDLTDGSVLALVDWLKRGGLVKGWKLAEETCPECGSKAQAFESKNGLLLVICPKCQSNYNRI
jgi:signal peptidase I